MGSDKKHFAFGIDHLVEILLVYCHKTLLGKTLELGVVMYDRSKRIKASAVASLQELFRLADCSDDSGTES